MEHVLQKGNDKFSELLIEMKSLWGKKIKEEECDD